MTRLRRIAWVAGIALAGAVVGASPSSAYFETMEVGARGVALGKTHVALADDASAVHWNPGGLPFLDRGQVILAQYRPHQAMDLATHFAAVSLPVGRMSMWSAWSHTGVPDAVSEDMLYAGAGTVLRWRQVRIGVGANVKLARVAYHSPAATASGELSG
ncbi:MAG: hypothetical protein QGH59_01440, partial [Gemmatimonadota bacterium]|nr:hypothetical protein [Gemmatimonadota bacterium]